MRTGMIRVFAAALLLTVTFPLVAAAAGEMVTLMDGRKAVIAEKRLYLFDPSGRQVQAPPGRYPTPDGAVLEVDAKGKFRIVPAEKKLW